MFSTTLSYFRTPESDSGCPPAQVPAEGRDGIHIDIDDVHVHVDGHVEMSQRTLLSDRDRDRTTMSGGVRWKGTPP